MAISQYFQRAAPHMGSKIGDTKTLNLLHNTVSLQVLDQCFVFFTLRDQRVVQQKHLLQVEEICCKKEEHGSTLSNKFWLCCSFCIILAICHATNLPMLCGKLRVFVCHILPLLPCKGVYTCTLYALHEGMELTTKSLTDFCYSLLVCHQDLCPAEGQVFYQELASPLEYLLRHSNHSGPPS